MPATCSFTASHVSPCRPIIEGEPEIADVARLLFEAPFAVLAHDAAEEPTFTYANKVPSAIRLHTLSEDIAIICQVRAAT
jgi:MEKHLA domain